MWVRQGRTDAWIAHKVDVSVDDLARFKREHDLEGDGEHSPGRPADPLSVPPPEPRPDDFEDDAEEDEEDAAEAPREAERPRRRSRRSRSRRPAVRDEEEEVEVEGEAPAPSVPARAHAGEPRDDRDDDEDGAPRKRRRRGRRGGRRHRARGAAYEATFDHGGEGYGLWLDPAVADNPVYSEHWAGHRAVTVTVEAESITIRRVPPPGEGTTAEAPGDEPDDL
jgi:hypothetical protein